MELSLSATTTTLAALPALKGSGLGTSDWLEVTHDQVSAFAGATGDHESSDVVPEQTKNLQGTQEPSGYLILSLISRMWPEVLAITDAKMSINYGLNSARFAAPVPPGSRIRLTAVLQDVEDVEGGLQITVSVAIEVEGGNEPVLFAEPVFRILG
jgi:acyl dehydratase